MSNFFNTNMLAMSDNDCRPIRWWLLCVLLLTAGFFNHSVRAEDKDTQETGIYTALSLGTAWAVTRKHVVTNYHVIANTSNLRLVTPDQLEIPVKVIAIDQKNDLAILVLQGRARLGSALPVSSKTSGLGTPVFTIGYPHPDLMGTSPKLTSGHINALTGIADDPRIYQVDVPVQSGNSGGPLINMHGEVIAVIASKLNAKKLFDRTGDVPQNVNYAIKIDRLNALLNQADISSSIRHSGFAQKQTLETLAGKSLNSVLIIAGDNQKKQKKNNPAIYAKISDQKNIEPNKTEKPSVPVIQTKFAIYSYAEPASYYADDNKRGSSTIQSYSESTAKLIQSHITELYKEKVHIISTIGKPAKKTYSRLDNKLSLISNCNKNKADIIISSYSEDNSGIGQQVRDVSFMAADCKTRRIFKKTYTIRRDELNDSFDYEMNLHDAFKNYLISLPHFIAIKRSEPNRLKTSGQYVVYSYAQPGHYDKEDNTPGSNTIRNYSANTSKLILNHINNIYGPKAEVITRSGRRYRDVYHQLENKEQLNHYCQKDNANNIISSFSENSGGRSIHFRHITITIVNCLNKRLYKKRYRLDRDEINDKFGYEMALHGTIKDFLVKLPPFIAMAN